MDFHGGLATSSSNLAPRTSKKVPVSGPVPGEWRSQARSGKIRETRPGAHREIQNTVQKYSRQGARRRNEKECGLSAFVMAVSPGAGYSVGMKDLSDTAPDEGSLAATPLIDADHERVRAFAEEQAGSLDSNRERAVALYYAVRDGIRYDPYELSATIEAMCASATLDKGRAWCVPKAILLAAACRALAIPARVGFADVRNHLSTERMRRHMNTDVFFWHGYTAIRLNGQWLKATPAFNIELCDKFRLKPLEFDGTEDSLYHSFDREGNRHMDYLHYRGEFNQVPLDAILATFAEHYDFGDVEGGDFEADVERETGAGR